MKNYGKEVIIDLHKCNPSLFTRKSIRNYFKELCILIDMKREKLCWWDDLYTSEGEKQKEDHLVGTSAVQFILTSNITIHTLDKLCKVYINIFSCKTFEPIKVIEFTENYFHGKVVSSHIIERK